MIKGMNNVGLLVGVPFLIYALLALLMGVVPGVVLSDIPPGAGIKPLSAQAQRGREVYVAEGCAYCHTQQIRPLKQDLVFGRPSTAGDYAYSTPQLLGSERNGPDLSNVASLQPSDVWNLIHLYQPRSLVSQSIMPPYPWLFRVKPRADRADVVVRVPAAYAPKGGVLVATQEAQDLIAYLKSLKQPPLNARAKR
jgi:cytochrome c oxidase cbb3-type subunit 2